MRKYFFGVSIAAFSVGFATAHIFMKPDAHVKDAQHPVEQPQIRPQRPPMVFSGNLDKFANVRRAGSLEPTADDALTAAEAAARAELVRRAQSGEYIMGSDDPQTVRENREAIENALKTVIPTVINAREEFFSGLELSQDKIARLTNHAARIAEASWEISPQLVELSQAKVEYDRKAKSLLSPEQYEKFREYETRQSLQDEWKRFGIASTDNLSYGDLNSITKSLEEMGIRERKATTFLPYDPEPSSGNWVTGLESDLKEVMQGKILRADLAAADLAAIAERNQLSESARSTLALMIENRRSSLARQMEGTANTQRELRDRFKAMYGSSATK